MNQEEAVSQLYEFFVEKNKPPFTVVGWQDPQRKNVLMPALLGLESLDDCFTPHDHVGALYAEFRYRVPARPNGRCTLLISTGTPMRYIVLDTDLIDLALS